MLKGMKRSRKITFIVGFLLTFTGISLYCFFNIPAGDALSRAGILVVWMAYYMTDLQIKWKQIFAYTGNIIALILIVVGGYFSYTSSLATSEMLLHVGTIVAIVTWFVTRISESAR